MIKERGIAAMDRWIEERKRKRKSTRMASKWIIGVEASEIGSSRREQ